MTATIECDFTLAYLFTCLATHALRTFVTLCDLYFYLSVYLSGNLSQNVLARVHTIFFFGMRTFSSLVFSVVVAAIFSVVADVVVVVISIVVTAFKL